MPKIKSAFGKGDNPLHLTASSAIILDSPVSCTYQKCGIKIPEGVALRGGTKYFCSEVCAMIYGQIERKAVVVESVDIEYKK